MPARGPASRVRPGVKPDPPGADAFSVSEPDLAPNGSARRLRGASGGPGGFDRREGAPVPTDREESGEVWFKDSGRVFVAPLDARWTFHPDSADDERTTPRAGDEHPVPEPEGGTRTRAPRVAVIGIVVSLLALVTGLLGATHTWPFHPSTPAAASPSHPSARPADVRGTWSVNVVFAGTSNSETMQIREENRSTGSFSGSIVAPVGNETIRGTVVADSVSFTITFGTTTISGTATIAGGHSRLSMVGNFSNAIGARGILVAARTAP